MPPRSPRPPTRPKADPDAPPARRMTGFEPAGRLVQGRIQAVGERRGFAAARILTHWDEVAGADLAAIARPVKVGYGREGIGATLTVLAAPAAAPLVEMAREKLRARVNAAYGYNAIGRVVVTQTAAQGFAEAQAAFAPRRPAAPAPAPATAAPPPVTGVRDPGLRAALERLAQTVAARQADPQV